MSERDGPTGPLPPSLKAVPNPPRISAPLEVRARRISGPSPPQVRSSQAARVGPTFAAAGLRAQDGRWSRGAAGNAGRRGRARMEGVLQQQERLQVHEAPLVRRPLPRVEPRAELGAEPLLRLRERSLPRDSLLVEASVVVRPVEDVKTPPPRSFWPVSGSVGSGPGRKGRPWGRSQDGSGRFGFSRGLGLFGGPTPPSAYTPPSCWRGDKRWTSGRHGTFRSPRNP